MKAILTAMALSAVVILACMPRAVYAQYGSGTASDTVWVTPSMGNGSLSDYIGADTTSTGARANPNAIYALYRDSVYFFTGQINVNGNLTIVSQPGTTTPPVIAPAVLADGSSPSTFINSDGGNLTLRGLYLLGVPYNSHWLGWGDAVVVNGDSSDVHVDSCVFDQWSDGAMDSFGSWENFYITNCYFVNDIHSSSYFGGHDWESHGNPVDTLMIVNNTMFNNNSYADVPTGYVKFERFDHNTVCLTQVNPINDFFGTNDYIENNIFYSTLMVGQQIDEAYAEWYDTIFYKSFAWSASSTVSTDTLGLDPSLAQAFGGTESSRVFKVLNNAYYWPAAIQNFWTAYNDTVTKMVKVSYPDSVVNLNHPPNDTLVDTATVKAILIPPQGFMNGRTQHMFTDKAEWPNFISANNDSVDPGFPSFVSSQIDSAIKYVLDIRANAYPNYMWDYTNGKPLFSWLWPLPELTYSNTSLQHAGTDGYALGDLNAFPSQLAAWKAAGGLALGVQKVPNTIPQSFALSQNYPNPFNPTTEIKVSLKQAGVVNLDVYNVLGQLVKVVDNGYKPAGEYVYNVNMDAFASGVYFYRLQEGANSITRKMLLLK